ncbi:MAG TPA: tetratricopeptide repeat protein [Chakrabartia sp.]|nr:tetratricopeptide repeat protein [Chakrabartia sp.]
MRFSPPAIALSLALLTVSSVSYGKKRADHEISPLSQSLVAQGKTALGAGKHEDAIDRLETALAVDPLNREAYIVLGEVARKQELPGKAIRYYREALTIEPNDVVALGGQGEALVQKGALGKARENLDRIAKLCISVCAEQDRLGALIKKAEEKPAIAAETIKPKAEVAVEAVKPKPEAAAEKK